MIWYMFCFVLLVIILSGGSPDNARRLGIKEVQEVPRDNRRRALTAGSSLERL